MDQMRKKKTYSYEHGGTHETPDDAVAKMKKQIVNMMEGGASDKEIMMMINKSPLGKQYEFNWDNIEMKVEAYPMKDDRFGPKDPPGQRGDMFEMGGGTDKGTDKGKTAKELIKEYQAILSRTGVPEETRKMYEAKIADLRKSERAMDGMRTYMHGGSHDEMKTYMHGGSHDNKMRTYKHGGSHGEPKTHAGQYEGRIMEDEGGKYGIYDYGDGRTVKTYFMEDPGAVGEYVPDNDYVFEEMDGKTFARLAPGPMQEERNPRERQIGKEVMEESTKGASKIENLLEKLMDEGRRGKDGTRTYRY